MTRHRTIVYELSYDDLIDLFASTGMGHDQAAELADLFERERITAYQAPETV